MIRLTHRRLIIPKGDTGTFSVPLLYPINNGDLAVFSIFDPLTKITVRNINIPLNGEEEYIEIPLIREDTINLEPKKYFWDIRIYNNPEYDEENLLVNGEQINSYYGGFSLPICEIKEVAEDAHRTTENTRIIT
jgi:hypothetical protein